MSLVSFIERAFPVPEFLGQRAAGIDISDTSVKWMIFEPASSRHGSYFRVVSYGTYPIPDGVIAAGVIKDVQALSRVLQEVRRTVRGVDIAAAHLALPEEPAYVFGMQVPRHASRDQVLRLIEFEFEGRVPMSPKAAVYDYDVIRTATNAAEHDEISVQVFPKDLVGAYADACLGAGITPLSFEVEARSIGRAIFQADDEGVTLLVDFGRKRTGFAVLKRGMPIFTSTVDVGGTDMTSVLQRTLSFSEEEAENFKNTNGLRFVVQQAQENKKHADQKMRQGVESLIATASALADEVVRHYHFWDSQRDEKGERVTPVKRVVIVGGNGNLKGLTEYIARRVHAPVEHAQVWRNAVSFDDYIPPIERYMSLAYATAIGLALRGVPVAEIPSSV